MTVVENQSQLIDLRGGVYLDHQSEQILSETLATFVNSGVPYEEALQTALCAATLGGQTPMVKSEQQTR